MENVSKVKIILFGVGGVGGWCAEALVRSGVRHLTIVDADCVAESNINRQIMATTLTVGRPKVEVLRERLIKRATDSMEEIAKRVAKAEEEMTYADKFDRILINDNLEQAYAEAGEMVGTFLSGE